MPQIDPDERRAYKAAYYVKNRARIRGKAAKYAQSHKSEKSAADSARRSIPEYWIKYAVARAKRRAAEKGIQFDLQPEDLHMPEVCPFTLLPFEFGKQNPQNPSIDRIKPNKGYTRGNVRIISMQANIAKNNITDPAVFQRLADDARLWSLV